MWKEYSKSYLKYNRAAGIPVMAAALAAALFLSLLCSLFYNFWNYDIEQIYIEEGNWQGRITGEIGEHELAVIQNFATVERAFVNEALSEEETVVDILFADPGTVYRDMPLIAAKLGLKEDAVRYHEVLLSQYFIHDPQDEEPPLLLSFYAGILIAVSVSLLLVIRSSFEVSMSARIHQFGIFSSIGATPRQILTCLLQEAAVLSGVPIFAGSFLGIGLSAIVIQAVNRFAAEQAGRHQAVFRYHPLVFAVTLTAVVLTVLCSAWIPARRLSHMTPLQAIRSGAGFRANRKKHSPFLSLLFGIEGELAGNALKAQRKSLRISTSSLLLSYLGFTVMLCFFTLADISTRYTYFDRYKDQWDVMVTVKDTGLKDFALTQEAEALQGVADSIVYQKAEEESLISKDQLSEELLALGGLEAVAGDKAKQEGEKFRVEAPIVILDDESFLTYCSQLGIPQGLDGAIVLNRIWDSINSNFREKVYLPFLRETGEAAMLFGADGIPDDVPVLAYTQEVPVLREEYADFALVHFMPLSLWNTIEERQNGAGQTTYLRLLAEEDGEPAALNALEKEAVSLVGKQYDIVSENRLQEEASNAELIKGFQLILGAFCGLLAIIGIAGVWTNTLGFLRQRKREFAQYLSIGVTMKEMRSIFCIEAMVIAGRPILITLPLAAGMVAFMTKASHLDPMVFWVEAPVLPVLVFGLLIIGFVSLAYYFGGRRLVHCDLTEILKMDTMQ